MQSNEEPFREVEVGFDRLKLRASIGVYEYEQKRTQPLYISVRLRYADQRLPPAHTDRIDHAIDYAIAAATVRRIVGEGHYNLLEHLALRIERTFADEIKGWSRLTLTIEKPKAVRGAAASVCVWHAAIGSGSGSCRETERGL